MYFTILKNSSGRYYWNCKAANHEIIAQSETYVSKAGALNAVRALQAGAATAQIYDSTGE